MTIQNRFTQTHLIFLLIIFLLASVGAAFAPPAAAQAYATLKVRVRYPDGQSAEGVQLAVYYDEVGDLPDEFKGDCLVPRSGYCEFTLEAGGFPYVIKFPKGQKPDPITAAAAGHQGIDGVGIILRADTTIGFVVSKLLEEETEPQWMLLDLAAEEDTPLPRVPEGAVQRAQALIDEEQAVIPTLTPIPEATPTVERIEIVVPTLPVATAVAELDDGLPELIQAEDLVEAETEETPDLAEEPMGLSWMLLAMIIGGILLIAVWLVVRFWSPKKEDNG
ncbi:MAG: hypothetical protein AAF959_23075 [Cyanobacteria bacterium P01_D01_bin.56]